ncbi:MAG: hypothetical protein ABIZ80_07925, partial [Bryobacteraceae bacterium]
TSGVVYPLAICELAKQYRLRNVGGSSAGAIAAAISAAAEYGRGTAQGGFQRLATVPEYLGTGGRLTRLFQPNTQTGPLFRLLLFTLRANQDGSKPGPLQWILEILRQIWGAEDGKGWLALRLAVIGVLIFAAAWICYAAESLVLNVVLLALTLSLTIFFLARWVKDLIATVQSVVKNSEYGLCVGGPPAGSPAEPPAAPGDPYGRRDAGPDYPLMSWLSDEADATAGITDHPLCFGDLMAKGIKLEVFTTSLTRGRPYLLPYRYGLSLNTDGLFFAPQAMRKFFPDRVVDWMAAHPPERAEQTRESDWADWQKVVQVMERQGLKPLPWPERLPVVVATRMSLSFPVLLSAVPLEGIDWTDPKNHAARKAMRDGDDKQTLTTTTNWFSDGGISSNFPIHFFDSPIPVRPTFGINLRSPGPGESISSSDQNANVRMVGNVQQAQNMFWQDIRDVSGFLGSVFSALHDWNDNAQLQVHGFWDRIAHVLLDESREGGLNLNMSGDVILALSLRGMHAGRQLAQRFDPNVQPPQPNWDSHRWHRYRTSMAMYEGRFAKMAGGFAAPPQGSSRTYQQLLNRPISEPSKDTGFPWKRIAQRDFALTATAALLDLSRNWTMSGETFREGAPKPLPHLRPMPPISGGGDDI